MRRSQRTLTTRWWDRWSTWVCPWCWAARWRYRVWRLYQ